jgi:hypothetical protein
MMRKTFDMIDDQLEVADAGMRRSPAVLESFRRHLRTLKHPPKGASLAVLRVWQEMKVQRTVLD